MKRTVLFFTVLLTLLWSCTSKQEKMENRMRNFISAYEQAIIPLYKESALASWEANIHGTMRHGPERKSFAGLYRYLTDKRVVRRT